MRSQPPVCSRQKGVHTVAILLMVLLAGVGWGLTAGVGAATDRQPASSQSAETSLLEGYGLSGENPRFRAAFFIKEYGIADQEDRLVARA